ncbi:MAG: cation acetate symporter [Actinobacteria bacterium]|nr:cation acetate symporter [Actinomycetota bacterium]
MNFDPLTVGLFVVIVAITLGITAWASRRTKDTSHHYVAGGEIKGWQNGLAIAGDFMSAATFLGIAGAIALTGFTGFYVAAAGLVTFLLVLLVVAEPLRNLGKYTLADVLTARFNTREVRSVAALNTVTVSIIYMIGQLVGAGAVIKLLLGIDYTVAVIVIGVLMTIYIAAGGMLATTWIQIVKAVLLMSAIFLMALLVLAEFNFNPLALFNEVPIQLGSGALKPSHGFVEGLNWISFNLAIILGTAGLPHILMRFFTVPDAKTARNSLIVAVWIIGLVFITMPFIGYGAALLVGQGEISGADPGGNLAAPQLAQILGGPIFFAFISAVAFATILAVVAGLVIAASSAFAHDVYTNVIRGGEASDQEQLRAARIAAVGVSIIAIALALVAQGINVAILVVLTFAVAASANVPVILLTLFWEKFNTVGAITGMLVGVVASVGLILLGPTVMGEGALFPLGNPALVSVPIGFLACYLGTVLSSSRAREEREQGTQISYDEIYVRSNTGISDIEEEIEGVTTREAQT